MNIKEQKNVTMQQLTFEELEFVNGGGLFDTGKKWLIDPIKDGIGWLRDRGNPYKPPYKHPDMFPSPCPLLC